MNKGKKLFSFLSIIAIVVILTGCYAVEINVSIEGMGEVKREVDISEAKENAVLTGLTNSERSALEASKTYPRGSKVVFEAIPDTGWVFSHWMGNIERSTKEKLTLVADDFYEIKAVFKSIEDVMENGSLELIKRTINEENINDYIVSYDYPINLALKYNRDFEIIKALVEKGADLNIKTHISPLHHAIELGNYETIKLLLEKGANPNSRGKDGKTALIYAIEKESPKLISLVLNYNANVHLKDEFGNTAWDYMKDNKNLIGTEPYKKIYKIVND